MGTQQRTASQTTQQSQTVHLKSQAGPQEKPAPWLFIFERWERFKQLAFVHQLPNLKHCAGVAVVCVLVVVLIAVGKGASGSCAQCGSPSQPRCLNSSLVERLRSVWSAQRFPRVPQDLQLKFPDAGAMKVSLNNLQGKLENLLSDAKPWETQAFYVRWWSMCNDIAWQGTLQSLEQYGDAIGGFSSHARNEIWRRSVPQMRENYVKERWPPIEPKSASSSNSFENGDVYTNDVATPSTACGLEELFWCQLGRLFQIPAERHQIQQLITVVANQSERFCSAMLLQSEPMRFEFPATNQTVVDQKLFEVYPVELTDGAARLPDGALMSCERPALVIANEVIQKGTVFTYKSSSS